MFDQLGLIGCGLMGGSFALALKEAGLVRQVVGYSKSPGTRETGLRRILKINPGRRRSAFRWFSTVPLSG